MATHLLVSLCLINHISFSFLAFIVASLIWNQDLWKRMFPENSPISPIFKEISFKGPQLVNFEAKRRKSSLWCRRWMLIGTQKLWSMLCHWPWVACATVLHLFIPYFTCQLKRHIYIHTVSCKSFILNFLMNTLFILKRACTMNKWEATMKTRLPSVERAPGQLHFPIQRSHLADGWAPALLPKGQCAKYFKDSAGRMKSEVSTYLC